MAIPALLLALQADPTRVVIEHGGLEQVAMIGQALVSVVVLGLLLVAIVTLLALRRALDELTRLVRSTSSDITAAVHDAREVADELRRLTGRVRDAADFVSGGVQKVRRMATSGPRDGSGAPRERAELDRPAPAGGEERPEARERSERRRRKRRRTGERPRSGEGMGEPPAAPEAAAG